MNPGVYLIGRADREHGHGGWGLQMSLTKGQMPEAPASRRLSIIFASQFSIFAMASPMRKSRAWLALLVGCCTVHSGLFVLPAAAPPRPETRPARGAATYSALTAGTYPGALSMRKSRIAGRPNQKPATARGVGRTLKIMLGVPSFLAVFSFLMVLRGYKTMETDGDAMQEKWSSFAKKPGRRMLALMAGACRVGLIALRAKLIRDPEKKSAMHTKAGKRAVTELVRLGPTYVKLGQILSCREDLVPKEYINELKRLQDEVPAFSGERAKKIIETELGKPASELFAEFDDKPLAAASLGQVHRAKTKDGVEMAIKIQRDNLKEMYDLDLAQFDKIAVTLDKFKIGVEGASGVWVDMFEDAKVILYREIDYRAEAENTQRWYDNFKGLKWTTSPKVINEFTTSKVLALTFVSGTKISDLKKLEEQNFDRTLLAKNLAQAYLLAFCKYGFFNTDPHPGNLAVDDGYPGGRLIFYDFGQAGIPRSHTKPWLGNSRRLAARARAAATAARLAHRVVQARVADQRDRFGGPPSAHESEDGETAPRRVLKFRVGVGTLAARRFEHCGPWVGCSPSAGVSIAAYGAHQGCVYGDLGPVP
eukprot:s255_g23.t1